jgi:hypothetical protein
MRKPAPRRRAGPATECEAATEPLQACHFFVVHPDRIDCCSHDVTDIGLEEIKGSLRGMSFLILRPFQAVICCLSIADLKAPPV